MGKKITQEEAERIFRENGYILIDKYKDAKTKMTAINKDGYRVYVSLDNIKQNGKTHIFSKSNIHTIWNIKNVWLPANAPEYELLDNVYVSNTYKMKWRLKNSDLPVFEMSWANFQQGQRHPDLQYNKIKEKLKLNNYEEIIKELLREYNPEWKLISEYINNNTPLLFINNEGYLAKRTYTNLKKATTKLAIFNKYYPEESTYNMYKYVKENCEGIELLPNQIYKNMHTEYEFVCHIHGKFKSYWCNFFYREQGCPQCMQIQRSKGEEKIIKWLEQNHLEYKHQYSFNDLKGVGGKKLRFDFAIFNSNKEIILLIEFQGNQHFKPIEWFGGEETFNTLVKNDKIKVEYCKEKVLPLLIIKYNELNYIEEILENKLKLCV